MIRRADIISEAHRAQQAQRHVVDPSWGATAARWAPIVAAIVDQVGAWSVLDYGAGKGALKPELAKLCAPRLRIAEFDPAVPEKDAWPVFADLVVVIDVLQHVEPDRLATILRHITALARKAVFVVVAARHDALERACEAAGFRVQPSDDGAWTATLTHAPEAA